MSESDLALIQIASARLHERDDLRLAQITHALAVAILGTSLMSLTLM